MHSVLVVDEHLPHSKLVSRAVVSQLPLPAIRQVLAPGVHAMLPSPVHDPIVKHVRPSAHMPVAWHLDGGFVFDQVPEE